jgi:hypothetical protein
VAGQQRLIASQMPGHPHHPHEEKQMPEQTTTTNPCRTESGGWSHQAPENQSRNGVSIWHCHACGLHLVD